MHSIFNHQIELDADGVHATGEIYNVTTLGRAASSIVDTWYGRYLDRYEQRGGEWRIMHRVCVHHGTTSAPFEPMMPNVSLYRDGGFDRRSSGRPIGP